ncbi:hypothetical protein OIU34_17260 [Pararhizobium sp. BT-229]|uniref:hypothetical protein n=1 Tax=Pararhizobium sp. BT-229 TaxID=2986923 RepID=UPI0021F79BD3|nr:hypothetical protein [Pararhizobium sp. BT-229]MCV9963651.1 hypothetical protein [Pararhizobium sp. BT-229]
MTADNIKTPIPGAPFNVIPSQDLFIRDEGEDAYQIECQPIVVDGVAGEFDIKLEEGLVYVMAFFGSERWGESIGDPVVVNDVRYSVALRAEPVRFADFDLATTAKRLSFSMQNLDVRTTRIGFDFSTSVAESDPVFAATKERFVSAVSRYATELAKKHPGFSDGFREAVATLEIARLRQLQELAWREMSERTRAIHRYMELVPDEMARVAPWKFSSQETGPVPIGAERDGLSVTASGVHSLKVRLSDGATFVISGLVDGSIRTDVIRP